MSWTRVTAVILAFSMLLIPVQFPGRADAAEETVKDTFFTDDFSLTGYETGVTSKWIQQLCGTGDTLSIADGKLNLNAQTNTTSDKTCNAGVYLSASDGTTDYASMWTDYSVEMKGRITNSEGSTGQAKLGLMGRVSKKDGATTFYYAYFRKGAGSLWLYRATMNAAGQITMSGSNGNNYIEYVSAITTAADTDYTLKMTFEGNNIKVFIDDVEYINVNDDFCTAGSAGVLACRGAVAQVDYVKVYPLGADLGESFAQYGFAEAGSIADLNKKWTLTPAATGTFAVADSQLTYADTAGATGLAALKAKVNTVLADSKVIAEGSAPANGGFAVIGRYNADANNYYNLSMDLDDGLKLIRCVSGTETVIHSISRIDLWEKHSVMLTSDTVYQLKLQMYGARVEAFIDDLCLFYWDDPEWTEEGTLSAGVAAVEMQNGTKLNMLEIAVVEAITGLELMYDTNFNGKDTNLKNYLEPFDKIVEVPVGHVPDVKHLYLKVTGYDGLISYAPVDAGQIGAFNVDAVSDVQTADITYGRQTVQLKYKVIDRAEEVTKLNADIAALNVAGLTKNDKAAVYALADRYDALSAAEKTGISDDNKAKLASAKETIEFLLYPTLAGTKIVFEDTFDTTASEDIFTTDRTLTHTSYKGNWYVENGTMLQYFVDDSARTTSFQAATVVEDECWKIESVSVDVQIVDRDVWGGLIIPFANGGFYRFIISDKVSGSGSYYSRIYLYKNTLTLDYEAVKKEEDRFQPGQWYNLKIVFDDDMIRCYIDDELVLESEDKVNAIIDEKMSVGTVGLYSTEGFGRFDNLVVRGEEAEGSLQPTPAIRDAEDYTDNFNDETAGKDPSHWLEEKVGDNWLNDWTVQDIEGNKVYATNSTESKTHTWLHVFETDVDYSVKLKVGNKGNYPVVGLTARVNYADSYIKAGYDYELQKWFIKVRYGTDFEEVAVYSAMDAAVDFSDWKQLRVKVVGSDIELYYDGGETPVLKADAMQKVMPGRVGVYTERCEAMIDDVDLKLLSEQGRVNEGVLEFYTSAQYCSILVLPTYDGEDGPNDDYLMFSYGNREVSSDGGKTFRVTTEYGEQSLGTATQLHDGTYFAITGGVAYHSVDCKVWTKVGQVPIDYKDENNKTKHTQTGVRVTEIKIEEGKYRIFFTVDRHIDATEAYLERQTIADVYYTDDLGVTWTKSVNSAVENTSQKDYGETNIIQAADGKLLQYCTYNTSQQIRYMVSNDNGVTWEGDYAIPYLLDGGKVSFCVKEDPYAETRTYYMATVYNKTQTDHQGMPRLRVVLLRSYDGYNWEFLSDVDRWGEHSGDAWTDIMQNINMYLAITPEAVFPMFCRAEEWSNTEAHNIRYGRAYRFDKASLEAYEEWPLQYVLTDKEITHIECIEGNITQNSDLSDLKFNAYYYRADGDVSEQISMDQAFVYGLDTSKLGEQTVTLDYKRFRTVFTVNVVKGDAPVIVGTVEDKTYCIEQEVTVSDPNGDLESVTLNGQAVTLVDGKFTVAGKEGQQTIVATDKAGNATTFKITVNAAHKGGEATCTDKAKCEVCGEAYGELNADKHTKEAKWTTTADKHSKAYECCGKVVVAEEAHEWKDGKCEECGYEAALGTEQNPIEIPADKETVKEEAKVEAGSEQYFELDEKLTGKTMTIKGEGAYAIIDGKKYEAVDGILEVKLPTKTGKISVIIGNAGSKAATFSVTIATPSEDNSDTGDNAAIVLFGSLMALSMLAAGTLLIPDIRKKLLK